MYSVTAVTVTITTPVSVSQEHSKADFNTSGVGNQGHLWRLHVGGG